MGPRLHALRWVLPIALSVVAGLHAQRVERTLNGEWETVAATSHEEAPPSAGWERAVVPGTFNSVGGEKRWLRRRIDIPAEWRGRRVSIVCDGVKYNSVHLLNGTRVGTHFRGYDRFEIDLTPAIRFGATNELTVGVCDWQGTFTEPADLTGKAGGHTARYAPKDVGLTPIGGRFYRYGIWADTTLVAVHPVHLRDVVVVPSVRRRELTVRAQLVNAGATRAPARVAVRILGQELPSFAAQEHDLAAGSSMDISWTVPWANPTLWDMETPHLYELEALVSVVGQDTDSVRTRFGFREFWCDGPYFVLNGTRVLLRSTSMWPLAPPDKEAAKQHLLKLKRDLNVICFRTHTQPWRQYWYDAADEVGMLMIPEGPVFNDDNLYRLDDSRFWDNYAAELRSMTRRFANNPSVVMYSLENEFWGGRMNDKAPSKKDLVRMGELMRKWDPTRPFMYESDGDPGGVADVIGIHYPHEMGDNVLYPDTCYWMDAPKKATHEFTNGAPTWIWDRTKPLYLGEYLWSPSPTPARYTTFFGDEAYRNYGASQARAIGRAWSLQTRAYRFYRVSGLCPWTCAGNPDPATNPMAAAQAEVMRPLAAFVKEYTSRFFSGAQVTRTLHVMNDTLHAGRVTVTWTFGPDGAEPAHGELVFDMEPAAMEVASVRLDIPDVATPTPALFRVRAVMPGAPAFEEVHAYTVYPPLRLTPPRRRLGVIGRDAAIALRRAGLDPTELADTSALTPAVNVLVVGPNAFPEQTQPARTGLFVSGDRTDTNALEAWVAKGGALLLCSQDRRHEPLGPARFETKPATMVFPLAPHHPALDGIAVDDLSFWRPDHHVTDVQIDRIACGGLPILVSGGKNGITHAPLVELRIGRGTAILCGPRVIDALPQEPVASRLLGNILGYLDQLPDRAEPRAVAVGFDTAELRMLASVPFAVELTDRAPVNADIVLCGRKAGPPQLRQALGVCRDSGGTVYWHRPDPAAFAAIAKGLGTGATLVPTLGPVALERDDPFSDGLAAADLWWALGVQKGSPSWARRPLDPEVVEYCIGRSVQMDETKARRASCTKMAVTGSVHNRPVGDAVILASRGMVRGEIELERGGRWLIGVRAKGTPAAGVWPALDVRVGGQHLGRVWTTSRDFAVYAVDGRLPAGTHPIEIEFTNDAQVNGEDRNAYIAEVLVQPGADRDENAFTLHTEPGALASLPVGAGRLVVDTIKWDEPGAHGGEARAWFAMLLGRLGAPAQTHRPITTMEAADMRLEEVPHNTVSGNHVCLANSGSAWAPLTAETKAACELRIHARGSVAAGEWPLLVVKLDGTEIGQVSVVTAAFAPFSVPLDVEPGEHELEFRFVNDFCIPGEADRNCFIDRVEIMSRTQ